MTQHTHDEVIAWIDREVIEAGWSADSPVDSYFLHHQSDIDEANRYRASLLANRAGLERHGERLSAISHEGLGECKECVEACEDTCHCASPMNFPCPTYTDIYDPIRSVM